MGRHKVLTERDIALLNNLYNMDVLKKEHIIRLHYADAPQYCHKRVKELINRGYIRRDGHLYLITDKGMRTINKKITVQSSKRLTAENRKYKTTLSDIYPKLHPFGWYWSTSRQVKAKYNLDRSYRIGGELENARTGQSYIVYLISSTPRLPTIGKIKSEIQTALRKLNRNRIIILCNSLTGYSHFMQENTTYGSPELHILPVGLALDTILRRTVDPTWLENLVMNLLPGAEVVTKSKALHADLELTLDGKSYYLTELITYDIVKRYHLLYYGADQAMLDKDVILLTLSEYKIKGIEDFSETLESYPHIRLIDISADQFEKTLSTGRLASLRKGEITCTDAHETTQW